MTRAHRRGAAGPERWAATCGRPPRPGHGRRGYYPGGYYPAPYLSPFYYVLFFGGPFGYDPFFSGASGYYSSGYRSEDDWSKRGNIQLRVDPKDVEVVVDGIPTAKGGRAVLSLPTGVHHIEIQRSGYRTWTTDLDIKQGIR